MSARNWKWMVPGFGFGVLLLITYALLGSPFEWVRWQAVMSGIAMGICAIASVGNLIDYRRAMAVAMLERRQNAMARNPLSAQLESARGVSPEVVKLLLNEAHRVWALRNGEGSRMPHSVLYHEPAVTDIFLDYFLKSSREDVIMPKRLLVQGRKNRFDPWGMVDEYTMYDKLIGLLARQGKVVKYSEYENYQWVSPWTPRLVAEDYGLDWSDVGDVRAVSDQVSAVS